MPLVVMQDERDAIKAERDRVKRQREAKAARAAEAARQVMHCVRSTLPTFRPAYRSAFCRSSWWSIPSLVSD